MSKIVQKIVQYRKCPYCGALILADITGNYHALTCSKRSKKTV